MSNLTRKEMIEKLMNNICEVVFTKQNGEERKMKCTLMEDVAKSYYDNVQGVRKTPLNIISVIDTEKNDWRRFSVDSVKEFNVII